MKEPKSWICGRESNDGVSTGRHCDCIFQRRVNKVARQLVVGVHFLNFFDIHSNIDLFGCQDSKVVSMEMHGMILIRVALVDKNDLNKVIHVHLIGVGTRTKAISITMLGRALFVAKVLLLKVEVIIRHRKISKSERKVLYFEIRILFEQVRRVRHLECKVVELWPLMRRHS